MNILEVGMKAPDFTLKDQNNKEISLKDFRGKKVLLSWHPLAWTGVCTDQMRALETNFQRFERLNTLPLGMSIDPQPSKAVWASALGITNTPLLADFWPHGKVAKDYGIFSEEYGSSKRVNFLIDEEGTIIWVKKYQIPELPDIEEVFQQLEK